MTLQRFIKMNHFFGKNYRILASLKSILGAIRTSTTELVFVAVRLMKDGNDASVGIRFLLSNYVKVLML